MENTEVYLDFKKENDVKWEKTKKLIDRALKMGFTMDKINKIFSNRFAKPYINDARKIVENNFKYENLEFDFETEVGYWYNLKGANADNNYYGYNGSGDYLVELQDNKINLIHIEYKDDCNSCFREVAKKGETLTAFGSCYQLLFKKDEIRSIKTN